MGVKKVKIGIVLFSVICSFSLSAQTTNTDTLVLRNIDTITYSVLNPEGNDATFTWTITGGEIIGQPSPYTAAGANIINVVWNNTNKTSVNHGKITVSKAINYSNWLSCSGPDQILNIQSWVSPKATITTPNFHVCSGEASSVDLTFEGKADYRYKWKVYQKDTPANIVEDKTVSFLTSNSTSVTVDVAAIENTSVSDIIYVFEVTQVHDSFTDIDEGDITTATVEMTVHSIYNIGSIQSESSLIRR